MSLKDTAHKARKMAYAPYSKFRVGAAIRAGSGAIYGGCNVENVSYPQGTCAEAGAIAAMIAGGDREISEIYVIADSSDPVPPCGGCRQKIAEFARPDTPVIMATVSGAESKVALGDLLPGAFARQHME